MDHLVEATKDGKLIVRIREFRKDTDLQQVEQLERSCDKAAAPPAGKTSIVFTNMEVGDPLCRVRGYPNYCMLVAEIELVPHSNDYRIIGVIRGGIKEISRPVSRADQEYIGQGMRSKFVMVVYISGLRVCHLHRRLGVAQRLVMDMEAWGKKHGAEYAYLATENGNHASVNLFTCKLGYIKFRSPSILVQPIHGKPKQVVHIKSAGGHGASSKSIHILKLGAADADRLYRSASASMEFFPKDIDSVLRNPLSAGTWLACYRKDIIAHYQEDGVVAKGDTAAAAAARSCTPWHALLTSMEEGKIPWAMASLWRYDKLIKFEVRGPGSVQNMRRWAAFTRLASKIIPWIGLPCMPNIVFDKAFGVQLMYGLHACSRRRGGGQSAKPRRSDSHISSSKRAYDDDDHQDGEYLMEDLCRHAHKVALQAGCKAVVAEMGTCDPLKEWIPHWPSLSEHDLWCVKRLISTASAEPHPDPDHDHAADDWCKWPPPRSLFLDPRDF